MCSVHINAEQIGGNMQIKDLLQVISLTEEQENYIKEYLGLTNVQWIPVTGNYYYYFSSYGELSHTQYLENDEDIFRKTTGNCFPTKEIAITYIANLKTYNSLKEYANLHNKTFTDGVGYIIFKNPLGKLGVVEDMLYSEIGSIYFSSKDIAQQAIKAVGEENILNLFGGQ